MSRTFNFFRAGGFDQVRLDSGADVLDIVQLDKKLWVALACPTSGLALDEKTLALVDTDGDGRIRANELIDAVRFVGGLLRNPDDLRSGSDTLQLSAIGDSDDGKRVAQAARTILDSLGKKDAVALNTADVALARTAFDAQVENGDGVIVADAAKDDAEKALFADVLSVSTPVKDTSGKPGLDKATIDAFFDDVKAHVAWIDKADDSVLVAAENTHAAWDALQAVRAKVDDYFARCRVAAFDPRALVAVNREEKEYLAFAAKDLQVTSEELKGFPLSRIEPGRALPLRALSTGVNPAWSSALEAFADKAVKVLLSDKPELTEADYVALTTRLNGYAAWLAGKTAARVEKLGKDRLRALAKDGARAPLDAMLAREDAQAGSSKSIGDVEKLVRLHRDLFQLVNNFVSFRDFYARQRPAIFQAGTLYLDQRACTLCLKVDDIAKHSVMAPLSRVYLVYCDCVRKATGEKMTIAAAFTNGDSDNLMVGRNGVFYDRAGKEWDATITKIVDSPISIRQAFFSPYKKLIRFVEEQVQKRANDADAQSNAKLTGAATNLGTAATTGAPPPDAAAPPKKFDVGVVAALGVAVGGITAAIGALLQSFFGLGIWMPLGLLGLVLIISGPSMFIAWLKLRGRNIGPLLDGNGWAVNANAKINVSFGNALTQLAKLPSGSRVDLADPYADKKRPWAFYAVLAVLVVGGGAWFFGKLDGWLPPAARSTAVLGDAAPAAVVVPPAVVAPAAPAPPAP